MEGDTLRDGIFALRTRRFGSVGECMVRKLGRYAPARSRFHDLYDHPGGRRVEVKFSIVQKKAETRVTPDTVLRCIQEATAAVRAVAFTDWSAHAFDCNIQQVKRTEFDVLYYGLFFAECVKVFRIASVDIKEREKGGMIGYIDRQHKGNAGEGQFHVTDRTLQYHLDNHLYETLTYGELLVLLAAAP